MTKALCPGSFDPVTIGHVDIIERASARFDSLVVAVVTNPSKAPLFNTEERMGLLEEAVGHLPNVEISSFDGLLVDFAKSIGVDVIVKGLRAVSDFDYEIQMAQMNNKLSGIETFFMAASPVTSYLSSSLVKEIARFGGDVSSLVPRGVAERLKAKFS
ncbi:MAG: pantetheine-phosphate adenylyltransferase [Acidimicrobiia bacterium]